MNKNLRIIALSSTLLSSSLIPQSAFAVDGLSANVAVSSNYLWRGVSQTNDASAVSGGLDYSNSNGFYVGTWLSNVDFGDSTSYETDLYLGITGVLSTAVSYDIGYIYYAYPDSTETDTTNEYDFGEVYAKLTYANVSLGANYGIHHQDSAAWADNALYLSADAQFEVVDDISLALHLGYYRFNNDLSANDYTDIGLSISKGGFMFGISDTNNSHDAAKLFLSYAVDINL
jgi:uncharacterized protein (TIGR02001 family)